MLCEITENSSFLGTLAVLFVLGLASQVLFSGTVFYLYYVNPTFEQWQRKSNPRFPKVEMVRDEIVQMLKGLFAAVVCPTTSLYLSGRGYGQGFCGTSEYGIGYHVFLFFFIWISCDFYEFLYHYLGHTFDAMWQHHRHHHKFWNPSPFAVIADEYTDQFVRSLPLLVFPLVLPTNIDLIFFEFTLFFYGYGTYLHWGFELDWLSAHNPVINTAYQHYLHHNKSINKYPLHTGFMFKIWDQMFGSLYTGECGCVKCERERGKRTKEQWDKLEKPDYSPLIQPRYWVKYFRLL